MGTEQVANYEKYLQEAEKNPFCTGSYGNVFSIAEHRENAEIPDVMPGSMPGSEPFIGENEEPVPEPYSLDDFEPLPEPEPEGGEHGGHMTAKMFPAIDFKLVFEEKICPINFESTTAAQTQPQSEADEENLKKDENSTDENSNSSAMKIKALLVLLPFFMYFL